MHSSNASRPTKRSSQSRMANTEANRGHPSYREYAVVAARGGDHDLEQALFQSLAQRRIARGSGGEKVFEDIFAIHRGERLFTNFAVHQPVGRLGFCLYTHHLVVRATFREFEIGGEVPGGHLRVF